MNDPFLSIIVPVYNVEKYLHQCVNSILAQTFSDFELLLVDDGATDSSGDICDEYAKNDKRVYVIHKSNGGLVSARKAGLSAAKGQYIGWVDGDDWIEPEMYQKLCSFTKNSDADIAICDIIKSFPDKEIFLQHNILPGYYNKQKLLNKVYPTMLYDGTFGGVGIQPAIYNKIYKKKLIDKILMNVDNRIKLGEDMACTYPCLLSANSVIFLDNSYFYHYRQSPDQMTQGYFSDLFNQVLNLCSYLKKTGLEDYNYDLSHQIAGRLIYFAVRVVENEFHKDSPSSLKKKFDQIKSVCNHPEIMNAYKFININPDKTLIKNKIYIKLIKLRRNELLFFLLYGASLKKRLTKFV